MKLIPASQIVLRKLPYKPAIFKQGLSLVLIPLLAGTGVLLFLNQLWCSAEILSLEERRQSDVCENINKVFKTWSYVSAMLLGGALSDVKEVTATKGRLTVWYEFYILKLMTNDLEDTYRNVCNLEHLAREETEAFASLPHGSGDAINFETARKLPKTLARIFQIRTEIKHILDSEWRQLKVARVNKQQSLDEMIFYAYAFTVGTILLAVLLVVAFARSISNRMRVLTESAAALPRHELPSRHLKGDDELAYLDRVLNETALSLRDAAEHRRSILGMVAHDMRSPLMSSQVGIQMIEEIGGDFPDGSYETLDKAHEQLASILQYVQQLLTVQKSSDKSEEESASSADSPAKSALPGTGVAELPVSSLSPEKKSGGLQLAEPAVEQAALVRNSDQYSWTAAQMTDFAKIQGRRASLIGAINEFIFRPKIFHQGLLLALVPIVFQVGFLLFVTMQIQSTKAVSRGEQRCSDLIMATMLGKVEMVRGAAARGVYIITGSRTAENLADKVFTEYKNSYDSMFQVSGYDPEWRSVFKECKKMSFQKIDKLLTVGTDASPAEKLAAFMDMGEVKKRSPEAFQLERRSDELLDKNLSRLHTMETEQVELANLIGSLLKYGILANFIVALVVLSLFSAKITQRLATLVDNAARLGRREELSKPVPGTDEIAYLELVLYQAKIQLDEASRQRAAVMSSLAGDMRAPLHSAEALLRNFAGLTEGHLKESTGKQLARVQTNIGRVLGLVDDLLTMETLETGKVMLEYSSCDLSSVVDDAFAAVSNLAKKKGISLVNSCSSLIVRADRARLVQVLINYLSNAIKFSGDQTTVSVSEVENSGMVRVRVTDQGPGMDRETRDRVFEKFFQANTEQKKQGFGLGLAICQLIVQSHGGRLGVDSELGKGSTFWFEIPSESAKR